MRIVRLVVYGGLAVAAMAFGFHAWKTNQELHDSAYYEVSYGTPDRFEVANAGPFGLFKFVHRDSDGLVIRAGITSAVDEFNATPGETSRSMAVSLLETTSASTVGWSGELAGPVKARNGEFFLVDRHRHDRRVITACLVKGNTTLVVTLLGMGDSIPMVEQELDGFKEYLTTIQLNRSDKYN